MNVNTSTVYFICHQVRDHTTCSQINLVDRENAQLSCLSAVDPLLMIASKHYSPNSGPIFKHVLLSTKCLLPEVPKTQNNHLIHILPCDVTGTQIVSSSICTLGEILLSIQARFKSHTGHHYPRPGLDDLPNEVPYPFCPWVLK